MKVIKNTARDWLIENGYKDVAQLIDDIMLEWKKQGKKTRRNWWEKLCGDKNGKSKIVSGRKISVLRAAQSPLKKEKK